LVVRSAAAARRGRVEVSMWTALPYRQLVRNAFHRQARPLQAVAARSWQVAPSEVSRAQKSFFLPNQLERVTGVGFAPENYIEIVNGACEIVHAETRAYLIQNACLVDGVIYRKDACLHLLPRSRFLPEFVINRHIPRGALYCTYGGNQYFGQWLIEDCLTYLLADAEATPITTHQSFSRHIAEYESLFEMHPERVQSGYFDELIVFDDFGQNRHRSARFRTLRDKLLRKVEGATHPGVYIVRGLAGERRSLCNEQELAQHLNKNYGLRVIDPLTMDVPSIVQACAGAQVVAGVEGSHLVHGMMVLTPGSSLLVIQPPNRFGTVLRDVAEREELKFGFVVGQPQGSDFVVSLQEVDSTIDLMHVPA
jgi:hypothetical protein